MTLQDIKPLYGESGDFYTGTIPVAGQSVDICYLDGLCSAVDLDRDVLGPLMRESVPSLLAHHSVSRPVSVDEAAKALGGGNALLFFPGQETPYAFEAKGFPARGIAQPLGENVIKGARDAFGETLRLNTGLIRRKIGSPDLRFREMNVGFRSQTRVAIVYLNGVALPEAADEVTTDRKSTRLNSSH